MKHRPPRNFDREASEADTAYQLAREQEIIEIIEHGRRPGVPRILWVAVGIWALCVGVTAWAVTRLLW